MKFKSFCLTLLSVVLLKIAMCEEPKIKIERGSILAEYFFDIPGTSISDLLKNPNFRSNPNTFKLLTNFESEENKADNYGTLIRGYIVPPQTGDYIFWISGDDVATLFLSDSDEKNNLKAICYTELWTNFREWEKYATQKSKVIHLEQNKKYYIEAIQKEGGGGDHISVGWSLPNGTKEMPIPGNRLEPCQPNNPKIINNKISIKINTALPTTPGFHSITGTFEFDGKTFPFGTGIFLPDDYFTTKDLLPTITTLHNVIGEDGGTTGDPIIMREGFASLMLKDIGYDTRHGGDWPTTRFNPKKEARFIGIIPQCPKDRGFHSLPMSSVIVEIIDWVEKNFRADKERTYLTGFSYGGTSTWAVAQQFPDRFAAIIPLSSRLPQSAENLPEILKNVGVWCGVGELDGDFSGSIKKMADIFKSSKHTNFHCTIVKNGNHHCYQAIYADPALWQWLLAQKRKLK